MAESVEYMNQEDHESMNMDPLESLPPLEEETYVNSRSKIFMREEEGYTPIQFQVGKNSYVLPSYILDEPPKAKRIKQEVKIKNSNKCCGMCSLIKSFGVILKNETMSN